MSATQARPIRCTSRSRLVSACLCTAVLLLAGCDGSQRTEQPRVDAADLSAAVEEFIDNSLSPGMRNLRAILVSVDGEVVVEHYVEDAARGSADVASVTKSVVSTLVGIAVHDGDLALDDTLGDLLPAYADPMSAETASITLEQLLTMTAGLAADPVNADPAPEAGDWVGAILRAGPERPPGSGFAYSSVTSHLLSAILVEATGRPLLDYARAKLFDPLGIDTRPAGQPRMDDGRRGYRQYRRADFAWPLDPQGINVGYGTLKLHPADLLKLGELYLAEGEWQGEQVVPVAWVRAATRPSVTADANVGAHYGYQWWVTEAGGHPAYAAVGFGGQLVEVVPDLGLVVVASTRIVDTAIFDSSTWQFMVSTALVPVLEGSRP